MQTGDGLFKKGEHLSAAKLNQAFGGKKTDVFGSGKLTETPDGNIIQVDLPENIYIKLTGKTGTSPIKYGWKEVARLANGTWLDTTRTANTTDDYAIELNNSNLSTSDGYIYRAERSPHTGEWLFFLRRSRTANITIRVIPVLSDGSGGTCSVIGKSSFGGPSVLGSSVPTPYRVANMTLRMQDYNGVWSTLKTWTDATDSTWGNYTANLPYTPSAGQPLTLELSGNTANGTVLGRLPITCVATTLCGTTITTDLIDSAGGAQNYFYGPVSGNITSCSTTLTNLSNVTMVAKVNATGSLSLPSSSINGPSIYTFKMGWTSDTGNSTDILDYINANYSASFSPGGEGGSAFASLTETHGGISITRQGLAIVQVGFTVNDDWTTSIPAWPISSPTYTFGVLKESATLRITRGSTPVKTVEATGIISHYGNASTSFSTINANIPTSKTFTDNSGNTYTLNSASAIPSGSC